MNECARRLFILAQLIYLLIRQFKKSREEISAYSRQPLAGEAHWYKAWLLIHRPPGPEP